MFCIEITGIPPDGTAPKEIKEKWVGLILPLYVSRFRHPEPAFHSGSGYRVYKVPILTALEILRLQHPAAGEWWFNNYEHVYSGGEFLFAEHVSKVVDTFPSLMLPGDKNLTPNLGELLEQAENREDCQQAVGLMKAHLGEEDWSRLQKVPLSHASAIFLADVTQLEISRFLGDCSNEEMWYGAKAAGQKFFEELYDFTWLHGIEVEEGLIKRPLSFVDVMVHEGYLEETDDRLVVPTKKAEREAKRMDMARNAKNN